MNTPRNILMVAAENDALPGGKVGGIGDVVRDVPPALAELGCTVNVIIPAYGRLASVAGAQHRAAVKVRSFGPFVRDVDLYEVTAKKPHPGVRHWVVDNPAFAACGKGRIYCDDPPGAPFATDAGKFALFCAAVAEALVQGHLERPEVLHLHDWHAAWLLILRAYHPAFHDLQSIRTVFSIHNLALQGVRPFDGHASSLAAWFPGLYHERQRLADPRWPDTVNPMAVGIRMADAVHTVSPTYAEEILLPSAVEARGYYGGEGLEDDLRIAQIEGRLFGILNGCEYPDAGPPPAPDWCALVAMLRAQVLRWAGADFTPTHFIAHARLGEWVDRKPGVLLTSISRITDQKMRLLRQTDERGHPALEGVLEALGDRGVYLFLGSGAPDYEQFLTATSGKYDNFVFLRGYSDPVSQALYAAGDLFLMPSSFEPCGISQMLAMRAGQPCLVHHVGGLKDTVQDGVSGFAFTGGNLMEQASKLVESTRRALDLHEHQPERWKRIGEAAAAARFFWHDSVQQYIDQLYQPAPTVEDREGRRQVAQG
ncbi:MAG: glycogen synthase [Pseudomonadota bacterium]|nr:glycogen synthase [Pseudomonadota bacterium]